MKIKLICLVVLCLMLSGCQANKETPKATGTANKLIGDAQPGEIKDYLKEVDAFVQIEIIGWLGETQEIEGNLPDSIFKVKIKKEYVNNTGKKIKIKRLLQTGTPSQVMTGYPLFQKGDKIIVGISAAQKDEKSNIKKGDYYIDGGVVTTLKLYEEGGKVFAAPYVANSMFNANRILEGAKTPGANDSNALEFEVSDLEEYIKRFKQE